MNVHVGTFRLHIRFWPNLKVVFMFFKFLEISSTCRLFSLFFLYYSYSSFTKKEKFKLQNDSAIQNLHPEPSSMEPSSQCSCKM